MIRDDGLNNRRVYKKKVNAQNTDPWICRDSRYQKNLEFKLEIMRQN